MYFWRRWRSIVNRALGEIRQLVSTIRNRRTVWRERGREEGREERERKSKGERKGGKGERERKRKEGRKGGKGERDKE